MRITLHLDTFDKNPFAYAILWLDDQSLKWSREGHAGLALPEWGILQTDPTGTVICGLSRMQPLFLLEGLELGRHGGPFEGEVGLVHGFGPESKNPESGHWHVQCVDTENIAPEFSLFADNQAA
ncbi:DUF3564 family protein [Trinickia dinghuensis]|uniref:DUF3564 family protein n=1 Tax=Trinickia dinghuensis TaxID=2291023 RepID=A0A3D8K1N1_9BURK|nr:DUF3564 family protein [Trinickia dinghuensis]RDU99343.1 DUF3564 family protein [Trinickia dinghuensis]